MKKLIILTALILSPLAMMSQESNETIVNDVNVLIQLDTTSIVSSSSIRNHTYFAARKDAIKLNHKKSIKLTSIKAFRKAAHIKSKNTDRC